MSYKLDNLPQSAVTLTQSVVQATQMLGLYQAELARVLGVRCGEVGELFSGKRNFEPDTEVCAKALLFIQFYELLYDKLKGDDVAMAFGFGGHHGGINSAKRPPIGKVVFYHIQTIR